MIGSSLTHYRVTAKLGEGGMGEVYRATDTKLGREVAIKVLPASFSRDPQSLVRFEREAKALASLNHPHIAAIHGFDADQGTHFLVLELVEGQTLSERLRRGRLPVDEALRVARQIAEAVEAAHAKGIIHRDLKPGNIKLTPEGRVKVLDFGLAKAINPSPGLRPPSPHPMGGGQGEGHPTDGDASTQVQPPVPAETTTPGAVMGTPAYMSPEQARGQEVDKRTDVWAFGCCLFECLAGSKPFRGETVTDLMAEVLKSEPKWAALPAETPREVATLLRRCLEKEPRRRLRDLGDIALLLEDSTPSRPRQPSPAAQTESKPPTPSPATPSFWHRFGPAFAALSVLALLGLAITGFALWRTPKTAATRASQIRSLAVLPFKVNSPDPKLAGLEKWIPLEIVSKLGQVTNLQVVNLPTKIELLVSQNKDVDEIARELKVDGLVRSELAGQGEAMTVYVTVVDSTGRAVGKPQNLPASVSKIYLIPNQVAEAVVNGLNVQLSASQRAEIQVADTQNGDAFLAFQKGRDLLSRRLHAEAAVEFRRAYQLDTNYTRAWTGLANSEWIPVAWGGTTNEMGATFKRLSGEAEQFRGQRPDDPTVASLRMWMALLHERDWNKVRTTFWESQRNPKPESWVWNAMSWYYTYIEGHPELALNARQQAIALDPENLIFQIDRAHQLAVLGRFDDAVRAFRSLPPEKIQLEDYSSTLLNAGDLAGAKEVATRVLAGRPNARTQCNLAAIHAKSGAADEARKILRELEAQAEKGMHIPYAQIAWSYGMLGDFESARRWLRQGLLEGHGDWTMLGLRTAHILEMFGKLAWYWEIVDGLKFPPLQMDNPYFALEQAMRYGRGSVGALTTSTSTNEPPKTLAVLPFVNLSDDKENTAFFADGMHEDILTHLANIPGLRVTSRTSVMDYRGTKKKIPEIARELGVTYILEGSVRRAGSTVRITGQLIRAANDEHLWAKSYDRELTPKEVFSIQAALATEIAGALKAAISPETKKLLERLPTENLAAYDLYLKARAIIRGKIWGQNQREPLLLAAVQLDPKFAAAWAELAVNHGFMFRDQERTPARLAQADAALARAVRLAPDAPETIMAHGWLAYLGHRDWVRATAEFERLIRLQPNNAWAIHGLATIQKRQGRWLESVANHRKALQLEPGSKGLAFELSLVLGAGRRWDETLAELQRLLAMPSEKSESELARRASSVKVLFSATGSTKAADDWLAGLTPVQLESPALNSVRRWRALVRGDYPEWQRLDQLAATSTDDNGVRQPEDTADAIAAAFIMAAHGDLAGARLRLGNLPADVRSKLEREPTNDNLWSEQALMEALLGQAAEALRDSRKAMELMPESLDAHDGPDYSCALAAVYAWTGDKDRALAELTRLLRVPFGYEGSVHDLRVDAMFAPLRGDPRFEALLKDPKNSEPLF